MVRPNSLQVCAKELMRRCKAPTVCAREKGAEECGSEYLERSEVNHWFCNRGLICSSKKTVMMVITSHRVVKTARDVLISYGYSILQKRDPSRTLV
ncbi:unnamed protein product [Porites lobata]|uniref:Uncharacterized protein n=1 Tax=Porites lobata TaxID=104759 RepID=A0ABN8P2E1_9CNID|nr:unnamed protein product [Porites lobata]